MAVTSRSASKAAQTSPPTGDRRVPASGRLMERPARTVTRDLPELCELASARRSMCAHRLGTGTRSRVLKRVCSSSMVVTQYSAQSLSAAAQVRPDRQAVRAQAVGDVANRHVGVVKEDDCRALPGGQLP